CGQLPLVFGYVARAFRDRLPQRWRVGLETTLLVAGHALAAWLAVWLHGGRLGGVVYVLAIGLPAALASYWMMLTNYLQHVGCDSRSSDAHSRNFVSPFWNWFVFDNGFHTVHHQHPGLHWSRYRQLHRLIAPRIDPALNQRFIPSYMLRRYVLGGEQRAAARGSGQRSRPALNDV
ncbi:MAG TPA: fatty acid desaturase, partial [Polyangiaceae bacterium]